MKRNLLLSSGLCLSCIAVSLGQSGPAPSAASGGQGQPVSYASITQLNGLLEQIETASKNTQADLVKLRIERWKTDGASKKQALAYVDSLQRNLQGALPEMVSQLRNTPEDLPASFKLYRNLEALYPVLDRVAEGAQMFGSKDDLQALSNDLNAFDGTRKQLADRIESLATSKESELVRLRTDLKTAQAAVEPPKKIVVDDSAPPKKPVVKKKPVAKPTTSSPAPAKPSAGATNPAQPQTPAKPQ